MPGRPGQRTTPDLELVHHGPDAGPEAGPDAGPGPSGTADLQVVHDPTTRTDEETTVPVAAVDEGRVEHKRRLRRDVRSARRERQAQAGRAEEVDRDLARVVLGSAPVAGARRVACYTSLPGEPGTRTLLNELRRAGITVLLPVLLPDNDLDWEQRPAPTGASAGRGPGPLGPHAIADVDLVIVPALSVDTTGARLGQGGGSYDRALARVPHRVPVMALVHDEELQDAAVSPLPVEVHDRRVQAVATPTRWLWLSA
ncbi:5-formyltetrahydrofolate cyclo-ligase [Kineococcus gynurae]|uniref:5-formyltetrahydrofolate cyclo-ligase n=1 Tax=Kineococcus gynurae TaxID=452979 RepID=A0ABV5LWR0_9ACTN